jgi:hypothetical protein
MRVWPYLMVAARSAGSGLIWAGPLVAAFDNRVPVIHPEERFRRPAAVPY